MEILIPYTISIVLGIFMTVLLLSLWLYIKLRMRWHEKGILDFRYDGWEDRHNSNRKTWADCRREEREYDRKQR